MLCSSKQIVCQLTGSVDSAIAALLLKRKGFNVTGLLTHSPYESQSSRESKQERVAYAVRELDIEFEEVVLREQQWEELKRITFSEYRAGRTPDLNALYIKHITFGIIRDYILKFVRTDLMATEHYARTSASDDSTIQQRMMGVHLYKGVDQLHDDSALLAPIPQKHLRMSLFPLGEFDKSVITHVAHSAGLGSLTSLPAIDNREEISELRKEVMNELDDQPGVFRHLETYTVLDTHQGLHNYTIGENVEIGGENFWVATKDLKTGNIMLVPEQDHCSLYTDTLFTSLAHWTYLTPYNFFEKHTMECDFRLHAHDPLTRCQLTVGAHNEWCGNDYIILSSTQPLRCIKPGHLATFYKGEEAMGSATILRSGPSHYAMNPSKRQKSSDDHSNASSGSSVFFTPFKNWYKKIANRVK